ncbi:Hypothetical predicted protein [Lynx pardinus]|uniref:Uncharacterized protein n=1 Tax=Lynx pardinus TaxID=191816 RepID=A0A485PIC1_LYNPA|nr:Hypothetical predicted protein [Lynx pardinus]
MNQTLNGSQIRKATASRPGADPLAVAPVVLSALAVRTCSCGIAGIAGNGTVAWLPGCRAQRTPFCTATLFTRARGSPQRRRRPARLSVVILASVLVFLVRTLPLGIRWFLLYWLDLPQRTKTPFSHSARRSSAASSRANPGLYFPVGSRGGRGLREPLGAALHRALREEPELEGRETPSTGTNEVSCRPPP